MGLFDLFTGRKRKQEIASALFLAVQEPYDRYHNELICDVALPAYGEAFSENWARFIRCRIDTPDKIFDFPAERLDMLADIARRQSAAVGPVFAEIRNALELVLANWRHSGLIRDSARFGLVKLDGWDELGDPGDDVDPIVRTLFFFDIDLACSDVAGELAKLLDFAPEASGR